MKVSLDMESNFQDRDTLMCMMASFHMCMPRNLMEMGTRVQDLARVGNKYDLQGRVKHFLLTDFH